MVRKLALAPNVARRIGREARVFDADLARLFRGLPETRKVAINCALYLQYLDKAIRTHGNRVSNEGLRREYLDFMGSEQINFCYRQLKELGIVVSKQRGNMVYKRIDVPCLIAVVESEIIRIQGD